MRSSLPLRLALVAALLIVAGCGSSSDDDGPKGPNVFIDQPDDASTVEGLVVIRANVSGSSSAVSGVEFFDNGTSLGTDDTSPYTYAWDTTMAAEGSHTLRAVATNADDLEGEDEVTVTVDNIDRHTEYFTANAYAGTPTEPWLGTAQCLQCHSDEGDDILATGHWNWLGTSEGIEGRETEVHGKLDILNNFCVAVPQNEGRCTMCHIGYGWVDDSFNFDDASHIDCLCCHDQTPTGVYAKAKFPGGVPAVDQAALQAAAESVGMNDGEPRRLACLKCHAGAGGGDNVKHGDIAMNLASTTEDYDVHMGTDGEDMTCVECHESDGSHGIGGMPFHSTGEGNMQQCTDCHGSLQTIHEGTTVWNAVLNTDNHRDRFACQVCHLPTFARFKSTKVDWDWSTAGQTPPDPMPQSPWGDNLYDKLKGTFVYDKEVRPTLRYHNGKWNKMLIGVADDVPAAAFDPFEMDPADDVRAVLAEPAADYTTAGAMIYPFKKMTGRQPGDTTHNTVLVPHLWGTVTGANPYWGVWDWDLALEDSKSYVPPDMNSYLPEALFEGYAYSGNYGWVKTVMYLAVNHEVAPATEAYGECADCHFSGQYDWSELGWDGDPAQGASRLP